MANWSLATLENASASLKIDASSLQALPLDMLEEIVATPRPRLVGQPCFISRRSSRIQGLGLRV